MKRGQITSCAATPAQANPARAVMAEDPEAEARHFLRPDETAAAFFSRTYDAPFRSGVPLLDARAPLRAGSILEVAGLAGAGKSELLLNLAAAALLPPPAPGGGPAPRAAAHVLLLDFDLKFDVIRLLSLAQARALAALRAARAPADADAVNAAVAAALRRFHLARCGSSFAALAALRVAADDAARWAAVGGVALVLIDNVAAHHYTDKASRGGGSYGGGDKYSSGTCGADITRDGAPLSLHRAHAAMAAGVRALAAAARAPVVATKHVLAGSGGGGGGGGGGDAPREMMARPWQEAVTHRVELRREGDGGRGARHAARWAAPGAPAAVDAFTIGAGGIALA